MTELQDLSNELLEQIFLGMEDVDSMVSLGSCCHRLMEILTREKVWKNLLAKTEMVKRET